MITDAAKAANDNSARGATRTPSVEHFNDSAWKQIGKLVNHLPTTATTPSSATSNPTADRRNLAEEVAAATLAGFPRLGAQISAAGLTDIVERALRETVGLYKT
ncbi:hypothetical protein, partial [Micromonospora parva]|uniref:hypothetical protein n=1 Tax=Micromonospora parva TaxID=1464048 RepID=UPI0036542CD6